MDAFVFFVVVLFNINTTFSIPDNHVEQCLAPGQYRLWNTPRPQLTAARSARRLRARIAATPGSFLSCASSRAPGSHDPGQKTTQVPLPGDGGRGRLHPPEKSSIGQYHQDGDQQ